jgi:hypothetical protein
MFSMTEAKNPANIPDDGERAREVESIEVPQLSVGLSRVEKSGGIGDHLTL